MTPEEKAQTLAAWLQSPPGTDPPADLDPEVLAAVVTLRPERAPKPRASFDSIVDSVESGPFKQVKAEAAPKGEVIAFKPRSSALPKWVLAIGSSGVLAAAAVALLFIPVMQSALAPKSELAPAPVSEPAPAAPTAKATKPATSRPDAPAEAAPGGGGVPEMQAATAARAPAEEARPAADEASLGADKSVAMKDQGAADAPAPPSDGFAAQAVSGNAEGSAEEARRAEAPTIAEAAPMSETERLRSLGYLSDEADAAPAAPAAAPPPEPAKAAKPAAPSAGAAPATTTSATTTPARAAGKAKADTESKKESAADDVRSYDAEKSASGRSAAVPTDYQNSWYTAYPDVADAYSRGDYRSLLNDSRKNVAMDAAWRAATAAWRSGDVSGARSLVDQGLAKSTANTVYRAQLLLLSGDLYSAAGDSTRAASAWAEAARLNASR